MSKKRYLPLGIWLVFLAAMSWSGWITTPIIGDMALFMPRPESLGERLFLTEIGQGPAARIILMSVEGGGLRESAKEGLATENLATEDLAVVSRRFASRLRKSPHLLRVENGATASTGPGFELLFKHRYLLGPEVAPARFSAESLRRSLRARLADLGAPFSPFPKHWLAGDPTGEFLAYLRAGQPLKQPGRQGGVWFSKDRSRALLLVETAASVLDMQAQERAVADIRAAFEEARGKGELTLRLTGPGIYTLQSRDTIRFEVTLISILASMAVVLILLIFSRSLLLLLLGALPLASAIIAGFGAVGLFYPGLHGITLAFGVILLGVTIDYPIHLFTHVRAGGDPAEMVRGIWPTLRLSWLTTGLGFGMMAVTTFTGLVQIGIFSATGIITAGLVTGWVVPLLFPAGWRPRREPLRLPWTGRLPWSRRTGAVTVLAAVAVFAAATFGFKPLRWEHDLAALSPIPRSVFKEDHRLRREMGAPEVNHIAFVVASDAQGALEKSEALMAPLAGLVARGVLGGFDMAALVLPSQRTQKERQRRLPDPERVGRNLMQALEGLPFRPGLFDPFLRALAASRGLPPIGPGDLAGTPLGIRVNTMLFQGHSGWIALVLLTGVREDGALAAWFQSHPAEGVHYLHLPSANRGLMTRFRDEALARVGWGVLLMIGVLLVELRSFWKLGRVVLPVAASALVVLSLIIWFGPPLTLFHLFSILLIFGIGFDYCIFLSRMDYDVDRRTRTITGLFVCGLSTVMMFGALAFSKIPILTIIGSTVAIGVTISFVFAMLLAQSPFEGRRN